MIQWLPYSYIRLCFFLIVGILLGVYEWLPFKVALYAFSVGSGAYLLLYLLYLKRKRYWLQSVLGIVGLSTLVTFGGLLVHRQDATNQRDHLLYQDSVTFVAGQIVSGVEVKEKSLKVLVQVSKIKHKQDWQAASGKVLLYIDKATKNKDCLQFGEQMIWKSNLQRLQPPQNPDAFNYARYLSFQQIYHQQYIPEGSFFLLGKQLAFYQYPIAWSLAVRKYCDRALKRAIDDPRAYALAAALTFGIREYLDVDIKQAFADAGATHILAVSGLHVGLIYILISSVLGSIKHFPRGKYLFLAVVLVILWSYAFVTGLSGSVLRAVSMFSLMEIAKTLRRNTNVYNSLAVSAFFLLCFNPYFIMQVGFQLSYLAVLGIVYLHPRLYRLWDTPNRWVDLIWQTTLVSVAAQVATFPITLYYFNQYPTYGLLTNLMMIPAGYGILVGGLLTVLTSPVPVVAEGIGFLLTWLIRITNTVIFYIQQLSNATIQVVLAPLEAWLWYGILGGVILLFARRRLYFLSIACILVIGISSWRGYRGWQVSQQQSITFYQVPGLSVLSIIEGTKAYLIADSSFFENERLYQFHVKSHFVQQGIQKKSTSYFTKSDHSPLSFSGKYMLLRTEADLWLFINQKPTDQDYQWIKKVKPTVVILQHNALYTLQKLVEHYQPHQFIIDSSNKRYLQRKLAKEAQQLEVNCWAVDLQGAFTKPL
ncbi:MAG: ComEC/Rec2 family competence protein [Thermonemataceae bacterium]